MADHDCVNSETSGCVHSKSIGSMTTSIDFLVKSVKNIERKLDNGLTKTVTTNANSIQGMQTAIKALWAFCLIFLGSTLTATFAAIWYLVQCGALKTIIPTGGM